MSHRKACSQGSIPFSWEDSPGVSKSTHHNRHSSPPATPPSAGRRFITAHPGVGAASDIIDHHGSLLPLPPPSSCTKLRRQYQSGRTVLFGKTSWFGRCQLEVDPFLAAYKECTKDQFRWWKITNTSDSNYNSKGNNKLMAPANQSKKMLSYGFLGSSNYDSNSKGRKSSSSKFVFSCKSSCDVEEGSLVARLANLPFLAGDHHHHRVRRR